MGLTLLKEKADFQIDAAFLIKMGVITQPEIDEAYEQALFEMRLEDFSAIWYYLTAWGQNLLA